MARDRNELLKWGDIFDAMMEYHAEQVMSKFLTVEDCHLAKSVAEGALYAVEDVPAADVAPVVHGRWIEQEAPNLDVYYDCSACGESFCLIEGSPADNLYTYCPNCGAKMDGEILEK